MIKIKIDGLEDLAKSFKKDDRTLKGIARKSLNSAAREGKKELPKIIRKFYKTKLKVIRADVSIGRKAVVRNLSTVINISKRRVPLSNYIRSKNKKGVRIEIRKGKPVFIKGAFVAVMPKTNHKGVFFRGRASDISRRKALPRREKIVIKSGTWKGRTKNSQLPIDELYTITSGSQVMRTKIFSKWEVVILRKFKTVFKKEYAKKYK